MTSKANSSRQPQDTEACLARCLSLTRQEQGIVSIPCTASIQRMSSILLPPTCCLRQRSGSVFLPNGQQPCSHSCFLPHEERISPPFSMYGILSAQGFSSRQADSILLIRLWQHSFSIPPLHRQT